MMVEFKYLSTRSGKCIALTINNKKYLFDLFEGFQRYCIEAGYSLNGISTIFLHSIKSVPPLIGSYLTVRDMGKKELMIVCTKEIEDVTKSAKIFADTMSLNLIFRREYKDDFLCVEAFSENNTDICHIINFAPIRGKFLVNKVPKVVPKHLYKDLTKKKTVEWDGFKYYGGDYLENDINIGNVAIVYKDECEENLIRFFLKKNVSIIFCYSEKVAKEFKNKINIEVYVLCDNCGLEFESVYKIQEKLNDLYKKYLIPMHIPKRYENYDDLNYINSNDTLNLSTQEKEFILRKKKAADFINVKNQQKQNTILLLGTGCALPSKYRNVSSTLYESAETAILFDCGEDTLGQILRAYGNFIVLEKLKMIFISHSHADHMLGITSILEVIKSNITIYGPSCIYEYIKKFNYNNYTFIQTDEAKRLEYKYLKSINYQQPLDLGEDLSKYFLNFDNGFKVSICGVPHCKDSCGVKIDDGDFSVAYSGDTLPSLLFGYMSYNSTVMIHEATFSELDKEKANKTLHSTDKDALEIFKFSKSKRLILTHFSQRYPKYVKLNNECISGVDFFRYEFDDDLMPYEKINDLYERLENEE